MIIEESLRDKAVLGEVEIVGTEVEKVYERDGTPWLTHWTLHTVKIADDKAEEIIKKLASDLESEHTCWYADFKNDETHYFAFSGGKIFKVNRREWSDYEAVKNFGIAQGIPAHQLNFENDLVK